MTTYEQVTKDELFYDQYQKLQTTGIGKNIIYLRKAISSTLRKYEIWAVLCGIIDFFVSIPIIGFIESKYPGELSALLWIISVILAYVVPGILFERKAERSEEFQKLCQDYYKILDNNPVEKKIVQRYSKNKTLA